MGYERDGRLVRTFPQSVSGGCTASHIPVPYNQVNEHFELSQHKTFALPPSSAASFDMRRWPGCVRMDWYSDDEGGKLSPPT